MSSGLAILAYLLIFLGLIGAIVPLVPGPLLIWLGALLWAWQDGFEAIGWPTLLALGLLTILAWGSDLILTTLGSRWAGAGWKAVAGAIIGGFLGGLLFSGVIPVLGTLLGAALGGVSGILAVEYLDKRNWPEAFQAAKGYILGFLAAAVLEAWLAFLMIVIFVWQAFL